MRITFCGTGAGGSIGPDRGNASIHLVHRDSHLLLDSGPGFLERMKKAQLDPDLVTDVIFSHLHFDHAMGVVDLFCRLLGRTGPPVTVYGPRDTDSYIAAALGFARVNVVRPSMNDWLDGVSVELTRAGDEREIRGLRVRSVEVPHAPYLECLARRFEADGRALVYSGDTTYAPEAMAPLADGADLLVHEAFTDAGLERLAAPMPQSAREAMFKGVRATHSNAVDAGRIAQQAGVKLLVLTHLLATEREDELVADARSEFDGPIVVAADGLAIEV